MAVKKLRGGSRILMIPVEDVLPDKFNLRKTVSQSELDMLTQSVKENGILCPLTVRERNDGRYTVISGERRRRAAIDAGLEYIPCVLLAADALNAARIVLCENYHRESIHYLDFAVAVDSLLNFLSISEISSFLSITEGLVISKIRILHLPGSVLRRLKPENIDEETAINLCSITDEHVQNKLLDIMKSDRCTYEQAKEKLNGSTGGSLSGFYGDIKIFTNTVEKAIKTMLESGIKADIKKSDDGINIEYKITISKLRLTIDKYRQQSKLITGESL